MKFLSNALIVCMLVSGTLNAGITIPPIRPPHSGPHHTSTSVAEQGMREVFSKYAAAMDIAHYNYADSMAYGDSMERDLASDTLYLAELDAEAEFWASAGKWVSVLGAGVWAGVAFKVSQDFAKASPIVQVKVAAIVAMLAAGSALAADAIVSERQAHYKKLAEVQKKVVDEKMKFLFWQQDYGGNGQPAPSSDLESVFPGCKFEDTCWEALVCDTQFGRRDCEKQVKCSTRIVTCF